MQGSNGRSVLDLHFNKQMLQYDMVHNVSVIYANGLFFDFDDYSENAESEKYKNLKPIKLTIARCVKQNLHYAV